MELTKEQQAYLDICEKNGWSYSIDEKWNEVELSQCSPAGEDFSFIVSLEDLPEKVHSFIFNFDVDEHVEMWIEAKREGVSGIPTTRELVDDAEAIEQMLEELSRALLDHKKGMNEVGLEEFNHLLTLRGSNAIFVDPPKQDTVWGVIELVATFEDGLKMRTQAFYDYFARTEDLEEPYQADYDLARAMALKQLDVYFPDSLLIEIEAIDWLDPDEFDSRIFDLDTEAVRAIRDVNMGFKPLVDEEKRRYHLISQIDVDGIVAQHQNGLNDLPDAQVADFSAADLSYFDLSNLDLGTVNSIGKEVCEPVSFEGSNLAYTNLSHDELKGAIFRECVAFGTCFIESNLENCDFSGAVLDGVDFTGALMKDTIFDETTIKDVILPNGQKLTIDDPADSLAVMERLVNPKADAPTNEVSVDDLVAQIKEKDDIVFADYWTRDEVVNRLAFEGIDLDSSNFEKVIEYAQDILSDHDMDLEEITRYARSFVPKETKAREVSPKRISPKADLAMGREAASQSPQDHNHNIGRSR